MVQQMRENSYEAKGLKLHSESKVKPIGTQKLATKKPVAQIWQKSGLYKNLESSAYRNMQSICLSRTKERIKE